MIWCNIGWFCTYFLDIQDNFPGLYHMSEVTHLKKKSHGSALINVVQCMFFGCPGLHVTDNQNLELWF